MIVHYTSCHFAALSIDLARGEASAGLGGLFLDACASGMARPPHDVIAIGDVHGDGDRLLHVLERLGLAEVPSGADAVAGVRWTGGTVAVVVLGDVLDGRERLPSCRLSTRVGDMQAVRMLQALARAAAAAGGSVTCVVGNHEAMNVRGDFSYVHDADLAADGGPAGRLARVRAPGDVGRALSTWKRAHIDNRVLFCHAGVHTGASRAVAGAADVERGLPTVSDFNLMEHRQYALTRPTREQQALLDGMLSRCGCVAMMIGHNTVTQPTWIWDGRVVLADCALSRAFGDVGTVHVLCVRPDGSTSPVAVGLARVTASAGSAAAAARAP